MARLPVYLRALADASADGVVTISSERLAELAGVNAAKVRKDLSHLGSYGTRGVGYDVDYLTFQMNREPCYTLVTIRYLTTHDLLSYLLVSQLTYSQPTEVL